MSRSWRHTRRGRKPLPHFVDVLADYGRGALAGFLGDGDQRRRIEDAERCAGAGGILTSSIRERETGSIIQR